MARSTKEWIEPNHDKPIPQRIKVRVADRADNRCQNCGVRITRGGQIDHITALINGGEHRDTNLQLLCRNCHSAKSKRDVSEKSKVYQTKRKLGPLTRPLTPWARQYRAQKEWKRNRELERDTLDSED